MGKVKQTFSLEEELVKKIKKLAIDKGKDYSYLVEQAILYYIQKVAKEKGTT